MFTLIRSVTYGIAAVFLVCFTCLSSLYIILFESTLFTHNNEDTPLVIVRLGNSYLDVVNQLHEKNIITHKAPMLLLDLLLEDTKKIKPGRHKILQDMSLVDIVRYMASREEDEVTVKIPDDATGKDIAGILARKLDFDSTAFMKSFSNPALLRKHSVDAKNFEGYLTPNTYRMRWISTPQDIIDDFMKRFRSFYNQDLQKRASQLKLSEIEILTLASIVDAETDIHSEFSTVASVYLNRIKKGMKLQADPTVLYAIGKGNRRVLYKDLTFESPYNTYIHKGLPPGPILNPSLKAIMASLYPKKTSYYYLVATGRGGHRFSKTGKEHLENVSVYRKIMREKRRLKKEIRN